MFTFEIHQGIKFLDKHYPGWYSRVDLGSLDMGSNTQCVLSQSVGKDFYEACNEHMNFGWSDTNGIEEFGFYTKSSLSLLTLEWKDAIKGIRNERKNGTELNHQGYTTQEALEIMLAAFDNPVARREINSDFANEARRIAKNALNK